MVRIKRLKTLTDYAHHSSVFALANVRCRSVWMRPNKTPVDDHRNNNNNNNTFLIAGGGVSSKTTRIYSI